ncbi:hypothetical protein C8R44DRAFT_780061 [Mycena epipterygia]|nr:hypothetical protein C8R44DRAFT_780061 [Mycena epipterygia]
MFSKPHISVLFALSGLFVSELALGLPVQPETEVDLNERVRRVVRVVARDVSVSSCSACATAITVKVSGTATATPTASAVTVSVGSATSTASPSTIGNFGSCTIPQIEFGTGFDGRKETAFQPVDKVSYNQASADSIEVITGFICNALVTTCNADATAQATCAKAQAAAAAATPLEGIDADAFNAVFGIQTNFKNVEAISNTSVPIATSTSNNTPNGAAYATSAATASFTATSIGGSQQGNATDGETGGVTVSTSTKDAPATTAAAVTSKLTTETATLPAPTTAANTSTSANLQVFTGDLGGVTAPAVVASGTQFQVTGNSIFKTKTDALVRSCDVQQNDCADAANKSGNKGDFTVNACNTQRTACNAASGG